jgi:hypothetical protein
MCMTDPTLDLLHAELTALAGVWAGALIVPARDASEAGERDRGVRGGSEGAGFAGLSDAGLVRVVDQAGRVRRAVDAFLARAGDEVARRSVPGFGSEGLAKRQGFASTAGLVAAATGGAQAEAARLVAVGAATRERESFTGDARPAKFEHVRGGLERGAVSLEAANLITGMLGRVEVRADPAQLRHVEERLAELASREPLSVVCRAVKVAESRLDPSGVAPADEEMYQGRSLSLREDANGVFHLRARLDPVTAAPVKAALDAMVSEALRCRSAGSGPAQGAARSGADGGAGRAGVAAAHPTTSSSATAVTTDAVGPVIEDRRSIPQIQADAFAELARHVLGCRDAPGVLPKTTVVVRMSLDALTRGLGAGEIDGIDRPIDAGTARRLAADSEVVPAVFGTGSVPLDLGRSARLFSRAQRLALAERDGGCASCGLNVTYAEAHHIEWWTRDAGPTDLANGVMLCSHCHHQVHDQGWRIRVRDDHVWFIPPPHVDPARVPRLGGRARFDPVSAPRSSHCPPARTRTSGARGVESARCLT